MSGDRPVGGGRGENSTRADDSEIEDDECQTCGHGESFHVAGGECEAPCCDCDHFSGGAL